MKALDKRIASKLVSCGELSQPDLERALESFDGSAPLPEYLAGRGFVSPRAAARVTAEVNGFRFVELNDFAADGDALKLLSGDEAWRRQILPAVLEGKTLTIVMSDTSNVYAQDELRLKLGLTVTTLIAEADDLRQAITRCYGAGPAAPHLTKKEVRRAEEEKERERRSSDEFSTGDVEEPDGSEYDSDDQSHREFQRMIRQIKSSEAVPVGISNLDTSFDKSSGEAIREVESKRAERGSHDAPRQNPELERYLAADEPALVCLKKLLDHAVETRMNELDLTPLEHSIRVRFRHLGSWEETEPYPFAYHEKVVGTLRLISGLQLNSKAVATDHQFFLPTKKGEMICTLYLEPSAYGERAVLRFSENVPLLGDLLLHIALPKEVGAEINSRLRVSGGGLLVLSSPSSRTLQHYYLSLMRNLAQSSRRDIISLERPHERRIPGVTAINCPSDDVLLASLANASFMNPDVLGVSSVENGTILNRILNVAIRGTTTIACYASPSSTVAMACLGAAKADPMNILRGVIGLLHVEEAKKLCPRCSRPIENTASLPEWAREMDVAFNEAAGCEVCKGTGYRGVVTISEFFRPDVARGDGSLRGVITRDRDLVAASLAGEIDPRDYAL